MHFFGGLHRRQRYIKRHEGEGLITNNIYYYGNVNQNKKSLLEKLGVTVISFRQKGLSQSSPTYYEIQYKYFLDKIEKFCK